MTEGSLFRYRSRLRNLRYHFSKAPWGELRAFEAQRSGRRGLPWLELIRASWAHGASFDDYYVLRFFDKDELERRRYITGSRLYELELQVNDLARAQILRDKALFYSHFQPWLGRKCWTWAELKGLPDNTAPPSRLVIKHRFGVRGFDQFYPEQHFETWQGVCEFIARAVSDPHLYLCEEFIEQHPELAALNPGTVNTLRIVTYCAGGEVSIWGSVLRVGRGKGPDNWAQGGVAALVDRDGVIRREARPKDPFAPPSARHPDSGRSIVGFVVPHFDQARAVVQRAALAIPEVRSIGWDVAVRADGGVCLVEGNDRWSYSLLQVALGCGCRDLASEVCDLSRVYV